MSRVVRLLAVPVRPEPTPIIVRLPPAEQAAVVLRRADPSLRAVLTRGRVWFLVMIWPVTFFATSVYLYLLRA